ncbi:hypothetical protein [Kineococcus sp. SYSU DK002]|uniref:hypothetical protein n=1 Tax=Kineococcus sp. SYSU DK002 TaxID=3383123 RepID=UPI003D7DD252
MPLTDVAAIVLTEECRPVAVAEGPRAVLDLVAGVEGRAGSWRALGRRHAR